jgi:hypothetical protein
MTLLITIILSHIVKVIATYNDGTFHLCTHDRTSEDTSTDGDVTSEGTLFVNISARDGLLRSLESQTDILEPTRTLALRYNTLVVKKDGFLLLEATLGLQIMDEERNT